MADVLIKVDETVMPEIAQAIMSKTGKSDPLKITQFAEEIEGISVGGGDSINHVEIMQAEYDALVDAGTVDPNTVYFIKDGKYPDESSKVDYIVDQGTSGIWTYRKWNSGIAECWGVHEFSMAINNAYGSLYYGDAITLPEYPFTFVETPICQFIHHGSSKAYIIEGGSKSRLDSDGSTIIGDEKTGPPTMWIYRAQNTTTVHNYSIACRVLGKWK